jgi:hypothetical protein
MDGSSILLVVRALFEAAWSPAPKVSNMPDKAGPVSARPLAGSAGEAVAARASCQVR